MRLRSVTAFLLGSITVVLLGAVSERAPQDPAQMQEPMKQAEKHTKPGPHHEKLARFLGKWTSEANYVVNGQMTAGEAGESECTWLMEGRWLQVKGTGKMLGQSFENFILLGYDNVKQSYVMTAVNTFDTAMSHCEGDMIEGEGALVLYGTRNEYLTGEHDKMVKYVYHFVSDTVMLLEVHDLAIGLTNTLVARVTFIKRD